MSSLAVMLVTFSSTLSADVDLARNWAARFLPQAHILIDSTHGLEQHEFLIVLLPGEFPLPSGVNRAQALLEAKPLTTAVAGTIIEPIQMFEPARQVRYALGTRAIDHTAAGRRIRRYLRQSFLYRHCVFRTDSVIGLMLDLSDFGSPIEHRLCLGVGAATRGHLELIDEPVAAVIGDSVAVFKQLVDNPDHLDRLQRDLTTSLEQEYREFVDGELVRRAVKHLARAELGDPGLRLTLFNPCDYLDACGEVLSRALLQLADFDTRSGPIVTEQG